MCSGGSHEQKTDRQRVSTAETSATLGAAAAGWSRSEVVNVPNALSLARAIAGPVIAVWVSEGYVQEAFVGLCVAGWSDWADGFVAKRFNQTSVVGTYLDPVADKVFITCVSAAMVSEGHLPAWVFGVWCARDCLLVGGNVILRARDLQWRWLGWKEVFRLRGEGTAGAARTMQPSMVSKLNTVLQLGLIAGSLSHAAWGWADVVHIEWLARATIVTTSASTMGYAMALRHGTLHKARLL